MYEHTWLLTAVGLTLNLSTQVCMEIKGEKKNQKPDCTGTVVTLEQHVVHCTCSGLSSRTGTVNLEYRIIIVYKDSISQLTKVFVKAS